MLKIGQFFKGMFRLGSLYIPEPMKPKIAVLKSKGVQVVQVQFHDLQPILYILKIINLFFKKGNL